MQTYQFYIHIQFPLKIVYFDKSTSDKAIPIEKKIVSTLDTYKCTENNLQPLGPFVYNNIDLLKRVDSEHNFYLILKGWYPIEYVSGPFLYNYS